MTCEDCITWRDVPAKNKRIYHHPQCDGVGFTWYHPLDDCPEPKVGETEECANCCYVLPLRKAALSPAALAALRKMVAWRIAHDSTLRRRVLDAEFGRDVWEEVAAAGYLASEMYEHHHLTEAGVLAAMGWDA